MFDGMAHNTLVVAHACGKGSGVDGVSRRGLGSPKQALGPPWGELDGQKAFTQGKVKIGGKMLKMMQLRGPLAHVQTELAGIDTEY